MTKIQHRRDNATNWASVNPVLGQGELAYNTTDGSFRIGDGTNHWSALTEYQYGAIHYMGVWDASGGSYPSNPEQGQYYVISVDGTISGTAYKVIDWIVYNGLTWNKVDNQIYASIDHNHTGTYEPVFTKNTAFNKNFGTASGTVCQGNDSRLSDNRAPTSHTHGNITNAGAIGSTANLAVITTTSGVLTTGTVPVASGGTGATTAATALTNLGLTATAAELNKMDGVTATTAELNYIDGVTSNIQTQLNAKAPIASPTFTGTVTGTFSGNVTGNCSGTAGSISGFNNPITSATASTIAYRDAAADIYARLFRSTYANQTTIPSGAALCYRIEAASDNYMRFCSDKAAIRTFLNVPDISEVASCTTGALTLYVDKAATGTGDGSSWANAFTTIQGAINSLPAIIAHAVVIVVRKGTTAYNEQITLKRVVGAGSIQIKGEYYWTGYVASGGSATGKFRVASALANRLQIAAGDIIWMNKVTTAGTENSLPTDQVTPTTIASVTQIDANTTEITVTGCSINFSVDPTKWFYYIVKTQITYNSGATLSINTTPSVTIDGLHIEGAWACIQLLGCLNPYVRNCSLKITATGGYAFLAQNGTCGMESNSPQRTAIWTNTTIASVYGFVSSANSMISGYCCQISLKNASGTANSSSTGVLLNLHSGARFRYSNIVVAATGISAQHNSSCGISTNKNSATVPESPAGSTDGAYIGA